MGKAEGAVESGGLEIGRKISLGIATIALLTAINAGGFEAISRFVTPGSSIPIGLSTMVVEAKTGFSSNHRGDDGVVAQEVAPPESNDWRNELSPIEKVVYVLLSLAGGWKKFKKNKSGE